MATNSNSPKITGGKRKKSRGEKLEIAKRLKVWDHSEIQRNSLIPEVPRRNLLIINPLMSPGSYSPATLASPSEHILNHQRSTQNIIRNPPLPHHQARASLNGPISILWDMENCRVPHDVRPEDASRNILTALRVHPIINGAVTMFSAYGDFNSFSRRVREGCQRTGVNLIDIPNGRKDAADKAILVDMFLFALDNPPPSTIMLISGDVDFSHALHVLGQRGYTVILVIPSNVVSSALTNAGTFVWDWPSVVRGEGFVPPPTKLCAPVPMKISGHMMGPQMNTCDGVVQNEVESIVYKGASKSSMGSQSLLEKNEAMRVQVQPLLEKNEAARVQVQPLLEKNEATRVQVQPLLEKNEATRVQVQPLLEKNEATRVQVQPGDLNGLKSQMIKLLESSGGFLPICRLTPEYQKKYGRRLSASEYGVNKLKSLLKKMDDVVTVEGSCDTKTICLRGLEGQPVILAEGENKGKVVQEEDNNIFDPTTEDIERVVDVDEKGGMNMIDDSNLNCFRYELMDILVSYSCRIYLGFFEAIYYQRYNRHLDYGRFGVSQLVELLEKVRDVAVLEEDPVSKWKFVVAVGGKNCRS